MKVSFNTVYGILWLDNRHALAHWPGEPHNRLIAEAGVLVLTVIARYNA